MQLKFSIYSLATIATWSTKLKFMLLTICCLLLMSLGYCLTVHDKLQMLTKLQAQYRNLQMRKRHKLQQTKKLKTIKTQCNLLQQKINHMIKPVSLATAIANALVVITTAAKEDNLQIKTFKPLTMEPTVKPDIAHIQLALIGSFDKLTLFIKQLMSSQQISVISGSTLTRSTAKDTVNTNKMIHSKIHYQGKLQLTMLLKLYPFVSLSALVASKHRRQLPNPFQRTQINIAIAKPHLATLPNAPLTAFVLSDLRFIGSIYQGHDWWAIILSPDKRIYKVTRGDLLGLQHARITALHRGHLQLLTHGHRQSITLNKNGE